MGDAGAPDSGFMVAAHPLYPQIPNQGGPVISGLRLGVFGGLIVFFLIVEPEGLNRLWSNIRSYFRVWPFSY